ncbi:GNAT family N-acetyltransferase [Candidatus Kaiserbacteria bacterium]|nr:GNAT family N-acetyltransferase [Candidatus Kaiserbacteria bacterium]
MRFFSSELGQDYSSLTFGYCNYAQLEAGDTLSQIYERGYLPYSGSPESKGLFYMARGGRLYLPDFELNSECRRVAKKFDGLYTRESVQLEKFEMTDEFIEFWLEYYKRAHSPTMMPRERLTHILNFGIISHVSIYKDAGGAVGGYTLEVADETITHDWYQSYAPKLDKTSFGMWLLIDIARAAKARGATYYYPGTVYGGSTDYKTNFSSLEYWNGEKWLKDTNNKKLGARTKTDKRQHITLLDEWKENHPLF